MVASIRALCEGLVDYAGLFPPAGLDMPSACENYARYVRGDDAWMLGRFICPASRLEEFTAHASVLLPGTHATSGYREHAGQVAPWALSVVIDTPMDAGLDTIERFNAHHSGEDHGLAIADAIEMRAGSAAQVDQTLGEIPEELGVL